MIIINSTKTEMSLLGLLISKPKLFFKVKGFLFADDFFEPKNKLVFQAMIISTEKHDTFDEILLLEELINISKISKNDWLDYIENLIIEKGIENNIDKYTQIVKEKHQKRTLETRLKESIDDMHKNVGSSISDLVVGVETKIHDVIKDRKLKDFDHVDQLTEKYIDKLKEIEKGNFNEGLKTNIVSLDEKIGGFKKGEFIIVAARPSMGKTAFALEISKNIALDKNVGFFSLEMPSEQLIKRLASSESLIRQDRMNRESSLNQMEKKRLSVSFEKIKKLNLWIDDSASVKVGELSWKARKLHELHNLDLIVVDYLQLIDSENNKNENRQQVISNISRQLKNLARELDIPIIAISQLSRRVEQREDKRPQMSDIRESGAIEQDADIIMFLYREDYYNQAKDDYEPKKISDLEVIISKHRNGPTGIVRLGLDLQFGKISSHNNIKLS